jgi:steroid delta-isomerase-like uncharacterized protein
MISGDGDREQALRVNEATYAAWNAHDPDAVAALFAEDAISRIVGTGQESRGREAIRAQAAELLAALPDFQLERLVLVNEGASHADRWRASGTHRGELMGIAATARSVSVEGATFTTLGADGLVAEDVHFWDIPSLLGQLRA